MDRPPPIALRFDDDERPYTGRELRSHFNYETFGLEGDSAAAWVGPCRVETKDLVDLDDRRKGLFIESRSMLHFLVEHFDRDLERAVLRQLLLATIHRDLVADRIGRAVERSGNDVFIDARKLSVSIATASPVSTLIHFGINVSSEGTPVPTIGLRDLGIDPKAHALAALEAYGREMEGVRAARVKVRGVP